MMCPDCMHELSGFHPDLWCERCVIRWDATSGSLIKRNFSQNFYKEVFGQKYRKGVRSDERKISKNRR